MGLINTVIDSKIIVLKLVHTIDNKCCLFQGQVIIIPTKHTEVVLSNSLVRDTDLGWK